MIVEKISVMVDVDVTNFVTSTMTVATGRNCLREMFIVDVIVSLSVNTAASTSAYLVSRMDV